MRAVYIDRQGDSFAADDPRALTYLRDTLGELDPNEQFWLVFPGFAEAVQTFFHGKRGRMSRASAERAIVRYIQKMEEWTDWPGMYATERAEMARNPTW
jgi:hypothetical protein